ncbi:biotin-independent malonate decarboxylase subunit gamma, partial [Variovorax sp. 2RAF20]
RITLRSIEALEQLAQTIAPMAYDIGNYQTLGLLEELLDIASPDAPEDDDVQRVRASLEQAVSSARKDPALHRLKGENRRSS